MDVKANKRIEWIDCAKGLGILLVIFAHSIHITPAQVLTRGIIFSFHMPLFFILYGMTFKFSDNYDSFKSNLYKRFRHLIIPALVCYLIITFVDLLYNLDTLVLSDFIVNHLIALLFCPGADYDIGLFHISSVSMLWFIFVLFYASVIIDYLHLKFQKQTNVLICSFLFVFGFFTIKAGFGLPMSLEVVFLIIPFILFGKYILPKLKITDLRVIIGFLIIWILSFIVIVYFTGTYLEIAGRRYPLFPVCHITAIAGTVFVCSLCCYFTKLKIISKPFVVIGRYTLYIFIAHTFDYMFFFVWSFTDNNFLAAAVRIIFDLILAFIIYKSRQILMSALKKN